MLKLFSELEKSGKVRFGTRYLEDMDNFHIEDISTDKPKQEFYSVTAMVGICTHGDEEELLNRLTKLLSNKYCWRSGNYSVETVEAVFYKEDAEAVHRIVEHCITKCGMSIHIDAVYSRRVLISSVTSMLEMKNSIITSRRLWHNSPIVSITVDVYALDRSSRNNLYTFIESIETPTVGVTYNGTMVGIDATASSSPDEITYVMSLLNIFSNVNIQSAYRINIVLGYPEVVLRWIKKYS